MFPVGIFHFSPEVLAGVHLNNEHGRVDCTFLAIYVMRKRQYTAFVYFFSMSVRREKGKKKIKINECA